MVQIVILKVSVHLPTLHPRRRNHQPSQQHGYDGRILAVTSQPGRRHPSKNSPRKSPFGYVRGLCEPVDGGR